jgi:hypothetical protein
MAKVDDLLQSWAKQIVLTIVARLAHGSPPTANLPSRQPRSAKIRNPKTQENRDPPPAFLQNRILAQAKSQRPINRFRILHGRLSDRMKRSRILFENKLCLVDEISLSGDVDWKPTPYEVRIFVRYFATGR